MALVAKIRIANTGLPALTPVVSSKRDVHKTNKECVTSTTLYKKNFKKMDQFDSVAEFARCCCGERSRSAGEFVQAHVCLPLIHVANRRSSTTNTAMIIDNTAAWQELVVCVSTSGTVPVTGPTGNAPKPCTCGTTMKYANPLGMGFKVTPVE